MRAPDDRDDGEEVADGVVDSHPDAQRAEEDHWYEAVAQDGRCPVCVDARLGHEVEEEVYCRRTEEAHAVDVRELRFAGLV